MPNKAKLAVIHVAKAQTGMTEEAYRELLASFGHTSSKELTDAEFADVMKHFETLGFVSTSRRFKYASSKQRLKAKVEAIRNDMGLTDKYINGMVRRMFERKPWQWCSADELRRLVAALTYHQKRKTGRRG